MRGCKQSFEAQSCNLDSGDAHHFDFYRMENADWPLADYEYFQPVTEDWCKKACLDDCFFAATIFRDNECWKKKNALSNGMVDPSVNAKVLIKIRRENSTTLSPKHGQQPGSDCNVKRNKNRSTLVLIVSVFLSTSLLINILFLPILSRFSKKANVETQHQYYKAVLPDINLQMFTYVELHRATNGFSGQLGRGAFGTVFRGVLQQVDEVVKLNRSLVAVKKLEKMVAAERE